MLHEDDCDSGVLQWLSVHLQGRGLGPEFHLLWALVGFAVASQWVAVSLPFGILPWRPRVSTRVELDVFFPLRRDEGTEGRQAFSTNFPDANFNLSIHLNGKFARAVVIVRKTKTGEARAGIKLHASSHKYFISIKSQLNVINRRWRRCWNQYRALGRRRHDNISQQAPNRDLTPPWANWNRF